jgi:hypothetical protein
MRQALLCCVMCFVCACRLLVTDLCTPQKQHLASSLNRQVLRCVASAIDYNTCCIHLLPPLAACQLLQP